MDCNRSYGINTETWMIKLCIISLVLLILLFSGVSTSYSSLTLKEEATIAIREKYNELTTQKGFPTVPDPDTPPALTYNRDGYYRFFNGYGIWWTEDTGAHEVHGAILAKWAGLNYEIGNEKGKLGYPLTDETRIDGQKYNQFQHGILKTTPDRGVIMLGELADSDRAIMEISNKLREYRGYGGQFIGQQECPPGKGPFCLEHV